MAVSIESEASVQHVRPGLTRRVAYQDDLMTVVLDFTDGPWDEPEPFHSHPHVQTSYIVSGEIIFYCEGERHLKEGDMYMAPSNKKHTIKVLTEHVRLIDNFYPLRRDFLEQES